MYVNHAAQNGLFCIGGKPPLSVFQKLERFLSDFVGHVHPKDVIHETKESYNFVITVNSNVGIAVPHVAAYAEYRVESSPLTVFDTCRQHVVDNFRYVRYDSRTDGKLSVSHNGRSFGGGNYLPRSNPGGRWGRVYQT